MIKDISWVKVGDFVSPWSDHLIFKWNVRIISLYSDFYHKLIEILNRHSVRNKSNL